MSELEQSVNDNVAQQATGDGAVQFCPYCGATNAIMLTSKRSRMRECRRCKVVVAWVGLLWGVKTRLYAVH